MASRKDIVDSETLSELILTKKNQENNKERQ